MLRLTFNRAFSQARRTLPTAASARMGSLRQLSAAAAPPDPPRAPPADSGAAVAEGEGVEEVEVNMLEGKRTRDLLRSAMSARAADAIRYDYFAQRADVEAELDVAPLFRTLAETARQQSMGYLELMEEYGDAEFGSTVRNLEVSSEAERMASDNLLKEAAAVASEEGFEQIEEWYQDMMDAGYRAADGIDDVSALLEDENLVDEEVTDEEDTEDRRRN